LGRGYSASVYGRFCVILGDSDSDILAMVIEGVASVDGGLCYRLYHARTLFSGLFALVWGFVASRGAIPMLGGEILWYYQLSFAMWDYRMWSVVYGVR